MAVLFLRLAGPLQAWGDASRFARRQTRSEPTKSGVLGLLAAAQGRRRTDPIEDLVGLRFGVRVDQPGKLTRDFQTAIRWQDRTSMPLSYRYYLSDAVFVAAVEGERALLEGLDEAVQAPVFPLYLGRRACPPSGRVSLGVVDDDLEAALRAAKWEAAKWYQKTLKRDSVELPLYVDAEGPGDHASEVVRDVPQSWNPERREYAWREVVALPPERMPVPRQGRAGDPDPAIVPALADPTTAAEPDFLAEVGGLPCI